LSANAGVSADLQSLTTERKDVIRGQDYRGKNIVIPVGPPYTYGWDATILSVEAPLAGDPAGYIKLMTQASEVTHPEEHVRAYLARYVRLDRLWGSAVAMLYDGDHLDHNNTRRMRNCSSTGVFIDGMKTRGWACSSRICPWCHMRLNFKLARDLQQSGNNYSVGIVRTVVPARSTEDMDESKKILLRVQKSIKRRLTSDYVRVAKAFPAYDKGQYEDHVMFRLAYLVRRGDEIEYPGMTWTKPRSIVGILRRCAKNLKTTTASINAFDYAQ